MNIEEQLKDLSRQECPRQVDVVDAVMAQVRQKPYLIRRQGNPVWRRVALTATAAAAALVVVNVATPRSYDEDQIGSMLAFVSDINYYMPVESAAADPMDSYFYSQDIEEE